MRDFLSAVVFIILFNIVATGLAFISGFSNDHVALWLLVGMVAHLVIKEARND